MSKQNELVELARTGASGGGGQNVVINGAMLVAQRQTTSTNVNNKYVLDRFYVYRQNTGSTYTCSQNSVSDLAGFTKSLKMDVTTADTSLASNEQVYIQTKFEGQMVQRFRKGHSDAKGFQLSFYVKTNKTGIYTVRLYDRDNNRNVSGSYTVPDANWNRYTVSFPADTTGKFDDDNNSSLELFFHLVNGSDTTTGTLQTTWATSTDAGSATGQVNLADSTSNDWEITGIQLQAGDKASDFEHEHISETENKCKRYYNVYGRSTGTNQGSSAHAGWCYSTQGGSIRIPSVGGPQMRIRPALGLVGTPSNSGTVGSGGTMGVYTSGAWQPASGNTWYVTDASLDPTFRIDFNVSSGLPTDGCCGVYFYSSSVLPTDSSFAGVTLDAEL
jgi:hypothetical protein|tara:strand:- start:1387 stop:2547 length:1161 start_codon:yes stop_codon:yes gene_type:complete